MNHPLQPLLHDSVIVLSAPSQAWSGVDGDMGERPIHGFYHSDVRVLDRSELTVGGHRLESISHALTDAGTARFVSLVRALDGTGADPRVRVDRTRRIRDGALIEEIMIANAVGQDISTEVVLRLRGDFTPMQLVKAGVAERQSIRSTTTPTGLRFESGTVSATVAAPEAMLAREGANASARWRVTVPAHGSVTVRWSVEAHDSASVVRGARGHAEWCGLSIRTDDSRLSAWVEAALRDLDALRMATDDAPDDTFLAAGAPWFFTLFGRDSIWAARLLLPLGTELAASTLRVLARLQGTREVDATAEQPGKIMHELRAGALTIPGEDITLPPLYYGTVDATALWVCLLHDAWRWGMADAEVEALLPQLEAALAWMRDYGDTDGDGFLEYADTTGHGLANQGWKDSGDSIQWRDGRLAEGPIALCEVQGYAHEAALGGAELLDRFGRSGGEEWRQWAARLKARFAEKFWIDSPDGAYPAVALDAAKERVDTVTSNIGHLLGTGILSDEQSALIARRLVSPELDSGYGLRTMSTDSAGYWPLSYHGGSVWTHDTAIAVTGLSRAGFAAEAAQLSEGLLAAAVSFDYRMPELHSGDPLTTSATAVPYPAACRPQAWSAAAAVAVLGSALGLAPGADGITLAPAADTGAIAVEGLRHAGRRIAVTTDAAGRVTRNALVSPVERPRVVR